MSPSDRRLLSPLSRDVRTDCPECRGSLALMRIIRSRAGSEYWTMRCTRCGGIHLDIVNPRHPVSEQDKRAGGLISNPHGEEARSAVSNREARTPSFETRVPRSSG